MKLRYLSHVPSVPASWRQGGVTLAVLAGVSLLALVFSLVLLPVALLGGAYLWWKTRAVRSQLRQMQAQMQQMNEQARRATSPQGSGEIIEGEVMRVYEEQRRIGR